MTGILWVVIILLSTIASLGIGTTVGFYLRSTALGRKRSLAELQIQQIIQEAKNDRTTLLLEVKEENIRIRSETDREIQSRKNEVGKQESRITNREESVERKEIEFGRREESVERKEIEFGRQEKSLSDRKTQIEEKEFQLNELESQHIAELERIASLTIVDAKDTILKKANDDMKHVLARRYYELDLENKEETDKKAKMHLALALEKLAVSVVYETTLSRVELPNDEMKGRLIGREGRNIRAIEQATGVDLIIDDTPEAIKVSSFDPVRREIARIALTKLVQDGRIHPASIEESVKKAAIEIEITIKEAGEQAIFETGVKGLHPELIKLLGRLKFRTSYGSNVLRHCIEASLIAGTLAAECGANIEVAKTAALLHDIGKALSHEFEGPHAEIGAEMAAKYGISDPIKRAIEEHHDHEKGSVEAFIVVASDAISSARPGARKDTVERYTQRLGELEAVANSFSGIEKSFAIQAGREIRIMVKPEEIDDIAAANLANEVTKKIQDNLAYPGQIRVVVIRETRTVAIAT
jgi:ribonuclease Y